MTTPIEALRQLLDAAEGLSHGTDWNRGTHALTHGYRRKLLAAIPAARAALAQAEAPAKPMTVHDALLRDGAQKREQSAYVEGVKRIWETLDEIGKSVPPEAWDTRAQPAAEPLSKKGGGVMSDDLIQRLRNAAITGLDPSPFDTLTHEAANEIERLRAATAQPAAKPQAFGDLTGVAPCCGEYAQCHRPCTPRGRWEASRALDAEPLSDAQIAAIWKAWPEQAITGAVRATSFARAIEAAHGIKAKP